MRRRYTKFERLETRNLLTAVINEILYDELFGDQNSSQYVELRGEPNETLADGTYLVVVDSEKNLNNIEGTIHGIFDLSGLTFGSNGFLVMLPQGSPYTPDLDATVLRSTSEAFGGLPGGIYTDSHDLSDRIDFIFAGNTFFLIQTDVAPQLGDDIDADSDGFVDEDGIITNWNVLDSITTMWSLSDGHGYGSIVFVDTNDVHFPEITMEEGTTLVRVDGFGYVGRIGNSTGSSAEDWVGGTVKDLNNDQYYVRLAGDVHGRPGPIVFQGRELDSLGSENFTGASRLQFFRDDNGNSVFDAGEQPLAGASVFADTNNNGTRDLIETIVEPNDFVEDLELNNLTPGVSLSTAVDDNVIIGFTIQAEQPAFFPDGEHVFAHSAIPFFNTSRRLRADFYRPAQTVSIDVIGDSNSRPTYGRLEAFDAAGNSLRMIRTAPLGDGVRQRLTIDMGSDLIAYAVAYPDDDYLNSSPFGKLDRLAFQVPEAMAVAGNDGVATLNYLDPGQYTIVPGETLGEDYVFDSPSFEITRYENYNFSVPAEINQPPVIEEATFSVPERSIAGTVVGKVIATDHPSQTLRYAIVSGGERFSINPATGEVQVRSAAVLDFESNPSYTITVRVTDNSNTPLSSERDFAINLTDINEAPSLPNYEFTVPENSPKNTVIGTVNAVDLDAGENGFVRYRLTGPNPGQAFSIDASTGELKVNSAAYFDFETRTEATITIEAFDAGFPSLTDSGTVKVVLSNVNEAPQIVTQTLAIGELAVQGDSVGLVRVLDPETSQSHTFAWADGFTTDEFVINTNSGEVTVAEGANLSFSERPEIVISVRATDNGVPAMSVVRDITVQVFDQNNPPEIQDLDLSVDENAPGGTVLGTASVIDPDVGQSHVFGLAASDGKSLFQIHQNTGVITVKDGVTIDFETQQSWQIVVQAWDDAFPSASSTREFTVTINNVNEAPTIAEFSEFTAEENSLTGTEIGMVAFNDPDGDATTVRIVPGDFSDPFVVDPTTGIIRLAEGAKLDFETNAEYLFTLEVTDGVSPPAMGQVKVSVQDLNEAPETNGELDPVQATGGTAFRFTLPTDIVTDVDADQSLSWSFRAVEGDVPPWVAFDPETLTVSGLAWNGERGSHAFVVTATDSGTPALSVDLPLAIEVAVNETPWTNNGIPADVNGDGNVRGIDALIIINFLNTNKNFEIPIDIDYRPAFLDVNGNNSVEPIDALRVINFLNEVPPSGEGESPSPAASAAIALAQTDALGIYERNERERRRAVDLAISELFD